jgi:hypothetical protein
MIEQFSPSAPVPGAPFIPPLLPSGTGIPATDPNAADAELIES